MTFWIFIATDGSLVLKIGRVGVPDFPLFVLAMQNQNFDNIDLLVGLQHLSSDVLVNGQDIRVKVALEIGISRFFRERSQKGNVILHVTELGITARVNKSFLSRMLKEGIVSIDEHAPKKKIQYKVSWSVRCVYTILLTLEDGTACTRQW